MRKVIAAFNMTLNGNCDHTAGIADSDLHQHYTDLLRSAGVILYGRTTFELMKYWQQILQNPTGERTTDGFSRAIDEIPKIVFSHQLQSTDWDTAKIASSSPVQTVHQLKEKTGGDILIGSHSLIVQLLNQGLVDELQLCIHPVLAAGGMQMFHGFEKNCRLTLQDSKIFGSGSVLLRYTVDRTVQ